jgi:hypothetical protein
MQILHPFAGSLQQYAEAISDPGRYRITARSARLNSLSSATVSMCARWSTAPLPGVSRYSCRACKRTVSLLLDFALPWLRFSLPMISLFLVARLHEGFTLAAAALAARLTPCLTNAASSGFAVSSSRAERLCAALAALTPRRARSYSSRGTI